MRSFSLETGTLDLAQRQLVGPAGRIRLTDLEVDTLEVLIRRAGEVVDREDLERQVWHLAPGVRSEAVPVAMRRLRSKLERDPAAPTHLHTVRGRGWTFVLPPVVRRSNLPTAPPLVGRGVAVARLAASQERWTTLLGAPGWGKTAVALAAAERARDGLDEVWFVRAEADLAAAVRRTLGLAASAPVGPALDGRSEVLLVVDAAETHAEHVGAAVQRWLSDAPGLRVWCTSTQRLADESVQWLERLESEPAAQLLVASARAAGVTDLNADDAEVVALVERLGRHPRAVQLAGATTRVLAPADQIVRVGQGEVGRELEAALAWSLRTLSDEARAGLGDAAWFMGDFDADAAEAVLEVPDVPAVLLELHERALLEVRLGRPRTFRVPAAVRHLLDRSTAGGARHAAWALGVSQALVERLVGPDGPAAAVRLAAMDADLQAAASRADPVAAVQLQWARTRAGRIVGLEQLVDVPMAWSPRADIGPVGAPFLAVRAMWLLPRDEGLARRTLDLAWSLAPNDPWVRAVQARLALGEGRYQDCLALQREEDPPPEVAGDLGFAFAYAHVHLGDLARGKRCVRRTIAAARARGDRLTVASLAPHPARWNFDPEQCVSLGPSALSLTRQVGLVRAEVSVRTRLVRSMLQLGHIDAAAEALDEVLPLVRRRGERMELQECLELAAHIALARGEDDELEVLVARVLALPHTLATRNARCTMRSLRAMGAYARGCIDEAREDLEVATQMPCQAASFASALFAGVLLDGGEPERAEAVLAARRPHFLAVEEERLLRIVAVHRCLAEADAIGASQLLERRWHAGSLAPWVDALRRRRK